MKKNLTFIFLFICQFVLAQHLQTAQPEEVGMNAERLKRIDLTVQEYVEKGWIPGAVTLILRDGKIVQHKAYGYDDTDTKKLLEKEAIFRIASQTKAITSTAIMMLYEEGKILLNEPISNYIPTFKSPQVLEKFNEKDSTFTTVAAKREVTIRDLLTHTSGIGYPGIGSKEATAIYAKNAIPSGIGTPTAKLSDAILALGKLPLMHQPGEKFTYGLNTDVLGYVVEVVSGMSLSDFFQKRIFTPIGMTDSYFYLPENKFNRLATVYTEDKDKKTIKAADIYQNFPKQTGGFYSGGAGLSASTIDYAKFLQLFLNEGKANDYQVLSPASIRLMTQNQLGELSLGDKKFGLGFGVYTEHFSGKSPLSVGSFDWGGIFGTSYWADPKEKIVALLMTQKFPNSHNELADKFKILVYQSISESYQK